MPGAYFYGQNQGLCPQKLSRWRILKCRIRMRRQKLQNQRPRGQKVRTTVLELEFCFCVYVSAVAFEHRGCLGSISHRDWVLLRGCDPKGKTTEPTTSGNRLGDTRFLGGLLSYYRLRGCSNKKVNH